MSSFLPGPLVSFNLFQVENEQTDQHGLTVSLHRRPEQARKDRAPGRIKVAERTKQDF